MSSRTLYDKLWDAHHVSKRDDGSSLIYIDRHLIHEVTSPQAFDGLRERKIEPWRVDSIIATPDHNVATENRAKGLKGISDSIGADEAYSKIVSWALDKLSRPEIEAFKEATNTMSGPQLSMMVQGLYTRYQNAMGVEPTLYSGRTATSGPTPYRSTAEVVTAMSDPRYGKDVTYTEDVQRRLEGSSVFG